MAGAVLLWIALGMLVVFAILMARPMLGFKWNGELDHARYEPELSPPSGMLKWWRETERRAKKSKT